MGAENAFVPVMARLWAAPVGTTAPDGPEATMPPDWVDLGLFTPDSLNWATAPEFQEAEAHQSNDPILTWQTKDAATIEVDLYEWTIDSFKAIFGGGTFEEVTPSGGSGNKYVKFTPPAVGARTETALCLELVYGSKKLRRIVPRAMQKEGVEQSFNKTAASTLPLRMSVLGNDLGTASWYDMSTLPGLVPPAEPES